MAIKGLGLARAHLPWILLAVMASSGAIQAQEGDAGAKRREPLVGDLDPDVVKRVREATVIVQWRHRNVIRQSLGCILNSDGFVLFDPIFVGQDDPISDISVVLRSGTDKCEVVEAQGVDIDPSQGLSLIRIRGEGFPHFSVDPSKRVRTGEKVWVGSISPDFFRIDEPTPRLDFINGSVEADVMPEDRFRVKLNSSPNREAGPVVNSTGDLVGILASGRFSGTVVSSAGVENRLRPFVKAGRIQPRVLPAGGGTVAIEARIASARTVDSVLALVEGEGVRVEVPLKRTGEVWTGEWKCPPLDPEGRSRTEIQIVRKDQSLETSTLKTKGIRLETKEGIRSLVPGDVREIRYSEASAPQRALTKSGWIEGTVEVESLGIQTTDVSLVLFETRIGRQFEITVIGRSGDTEFRGGPRFLRVGCAEDFAPPLDVPKRKTDVLERQLPGTPGRILPCRGGKYLLIHFTNLHTLGVFDFENLEFVKYLRLEREPMLFAAGRSKLLILYPEKGRLERWSLESLELEVSVPTPWAKAPQAIVMGWDSDKPALVIGPLNYHNQGAEISLFDIRQMRAIPAEPNGALLRTGFEKSNQFRSSARGDRVVWSGSARGWAGVIEFEGEIPKPRYDPQLMPLSPGGIGQVTTPEFLNIPALGGALYLCLIPQVNGRQDWRGAIWGVSGREKINTLEFSVYDQLDVYGNRVERDELSPDDRIWFHPRARVLLTIPASNDRLLCRPFDLEERLDRAGIDYLYIDSIPETEVPTGADWKYHLRVISKKGSIRIRLVSVPEGMKISDGNILTWSATKPGDWPVRLLVGDASGMESEHAFTIRVR